MDDRRFDALARSLGRTHNRRNALGMLAGAASLALAGAEAKRRKGNGKGRKRDAHPANTISPVCAAAGSATCTVAQAKPGAVLRDCNYAGADLSGKSLNAANLSKASFASGKLDGANLSGANLAAACLAGTSMTGAKLLGASLQGADLTGADLSGADLRGSNAKDGQLATATLSCATILPSGKKAACPAGTACCDGTHCTDTQADRDHCGACGTVCPLGQKCCSGICTVVVGSSCACGTCSLCDPGFEYLNGLCFWIVDTSDRQEQCTDAGCTPYNTIDGSNNILCATIAGGAATCTTTADCPIGQGCQMTNNRCASACHGPI